MKYTIEELGEFADDNANGNFTIWRVPLNCRDDTYLQTELWGARLDGQDHFGATPDEAIDKAIDAHERESS